MSPVPQFLLDLVERFAHNMDYYHRPDYNETQARREFIDPFFMALGWDVDNRQGVAPRYQEVIHEATLREKEATRAPDYCFRVGAERKFFVEAKKPAVDIYYDIHPAFQLRRYAWTAELPLSILTDFEEFSVYDCQVPPKATDKAATARVLYVKFTEYAERWEEIASIFSREAVWRGDYDRYAETTKGKSGTQEVDDVFLQEIESWRELLARNIALRNPTLNVRDLNYAVQQTIDRLIFLRICEDRGIEPYEQLKEAAQNGSVYARLMELFRRADDRYNSGLFHFRPEKGREEPDALTPDLRVDDKPLAEIITNLYYPHSPYAFEVLSADILGNVYERFLGSVIRLTPGHQAKVEQKPEVRKAGGVYYTPKYIVDYIVRHTVGALCEGKTPREIAGEHTTGEHAGSPLRILDPACGSGSFLLGAYQYLLDYHLNWYVEHPTKQARREVYQGRGGEWFLTTEEKKRILLNNLYGVDIDPQAVEVTKLSLLLKVLEGENQETLAQQLELFRERALPDLAGNIKCGNSLIGYDFLEQMPLLEEERYRINPFDWQSEFPQVFATSRRGEEAGNAIAPFRGGDAPASSPQQGGFDVVLGNPPYIRIQTMKEWAPREAELYKEHYQAASKGNYDIYVVFVEKGLSLLNAHGRLGFILPHKFFNAQYGAPLRQLISQGKHLAEVVHFGDQQVFENATTYTCLLFLDKAGRDSCYVQKVSDLPAWLAHRQAVAGIVPAARITEAEWNLAIGPGADLFQRLSEMPVKLENATSRIFQGLKTGADKVYIVDEVERGENRVLVYSAEKGREYWIEADLLHPLIKGGDSKRYSMSRTKRLILFPYARKTGNLTELIPAPTLEATYPLAWAYLCDNQRVLESRDHGKLRGPAWYGFSRNQALDVMPLPKVFTPDIAPTSAFSQDETGEVFFTGGVAGGYGILVLPDYSTHYVLGLLNSKLLEWLVHRSGTQMRGGWFSYESRFIRGLPIRTINFSDPADVARHDQMVELVERMLSLHQRLAAAKTPTAKTLLQRQIAATDRQIDRLVYELYGLTEEEIGIVEGQRS